MVKTSNVIALVAASSVLVLLLVLLPDEPALEPSPGRANDAYVDDSDSAYSTTPSQAELETTTRTPAQHDAMVISPSLAGTDIDGALRSDADGSLILDIGVRDFFDYFLTTADEIGAENAIDEVVRYIQTYLPDPAKQQALALFESYLRFKRFEFGVHQTPITEATLTDAKALSLLQENVALIRTHRRSLFTEEQDMALFGLQDAYADHTMATLTVMASQTLSEEEKLTQIANLKQQLPPELRASMDETAAARQQQLEISSQLESAMDDAQLHQSLIAQGLTQTKADELVAYRQQQRQFESDYQSYRSARLSLDVDAETYEGDLASLRAQFFLTPEHKTQAILRDLRDK